MSKEDEVQKLPRPSNLRSRIIQENGLLIEYNIWGGATIRRVQPTESQPRIQILLVPQSAPKGKS